MRRLQLGMKAAFDYAAAAIGLLVALPLFAIACLCIKVHSPGPVFFTQERIGWRGRPFQIIKFRTMDVGSSADERGNVTVRNDSRLFTGARLLRKFKIDELPQLLNVLNGTMSLVGPRPTVAEDYLRMDDRQKQRTLVKPGLSGLAQIRGGAALPWPARIEHDLQYIHNYSFAWDMAILAYTVVLIVAGRADSNPVHADEWMTDLDTDHENDRAIRRAA